MATITQTKTKTGIPKKNQVHQHNHQKINQQVLSQHPQQMTTVKILPRTLQNKTLCFLTLGRYCKKQNRRGERVMLNHRFRVQHKTPTTPSSLISRVDPSLQPVAPRVRPDERQLTQAEVRKLVGDVVRGTRILCTQCGGSVLHHDEGEVKLRRLKDDFDTESESSRRSYETQGGYHPSKTKSSTPQRRFSNSDVSNDVTGTRQSHDVNDKSQGHPTRGGRGGSSRGRGHGRGGNHNNKPSSSKKRAPDKPNNASDETAYERAKSSRYNRGRFDKNKTKADEQARNARSERRKGDQGADDVKPPENKGDEKSPDATKTPSASLLFIATSACSECDCG